MYTSQSKLRKHVTATHNLVVQADPDRPDDTVQMSPSAPSSMTTNQAEPGMILGTSGVKSGPEVPIMTGPGSLVQTKTLFKTVDGRIMCPIADCTNTFPHYAR